MRSRNTKFALDADRNVEKGVATLPKVRSLKVISLALILLLTSVPASAQSTKDGETHFARNAVYLEALGPGVFYSFNYERRLTEIMSLRGGFTAWNGLVGFPLMVNGLLGQDEDYFEIGVGLVPGYTPISLLPSRSFIIRGTGNEVVYGTATLGYRYQPHDGGLLFRISFTPIFERHNTFMSWGGISAGYAF